MKLTKVDLAGIKTSVTGSDTLFASPLNAQLLAQVIRVYLANLRQGTSKAKTRGEVERTKRKWYRQKGTGNARHGSRNAPIFVGGGVTHGPKGNQNWSRTLTPRLKQQGLMKALTAQSARVFVLSGASDLSGKTKEGKSFIKAIGVEGEKALVVLESTQTAVARSMRNLPEVLVVQASQLTALEVMTADVIIMTSEALDILEKRVATSIKAKISSKKSVEAPKVLASDKTTAKTTAAVTKTKITKDGEAKSKLKTKRVVKKKDAA